MDVDDISRPKRFDLKNANFESLKQVLLLTPLSNGIHSVNSIEKFDSLWDLWNDFHGKKTLVHRQFYQTVNTR